MQVLSRSVGGLRSKTIRERTGLARSRTGALPGPHGRRYEPGGAAAAETGLRLPSTSALRLDPLAATGPTRAGSRRAGCTGYAARGALPCSRRAPVAAELDTPAGGALPRQGLGGALLSALPARGILARAAAHTGPGRRPPPPARGLAGPCGGRPRSKAPPPDRRCGGSPAPRAKPPPSSLGPNLLQVGSSQPPWQQRVRLGGGLIPRFKMTRTRRPSLRDAHCGLSSAIKGTEISQASCF